MTTTPAESVTSPATAPVARQARLGGPERLMGHALDVFLPDSWPESGATVHWCGRRGGSTASGQSSDLAELRTSWKAAHVTVWTPPGDTLLTHVSLPTRSWSKIQQALPYALEDQLLGDPEKLHFAYHRQRDGTLAVAVTARERLQVWLEALRDSGLVPSRLCPATLALPLDAGDWSLLFTDHRLWVRTGLFAGFVCPVALETAPPLLSTAVTEARSKHTAPARLTVFDPPAAFQADAWRASLGSEIETSQRSFWQTGASTPPPLNLLQGEFAPSGKLRDSLRPLRLGASVLTVWFLGAIGFSLWEWWQLNEQHRSNRQAMVQLFQKTFPEAKVVLDPARQMERNLQSLQHQSGDAGSGGLLALLAQAAPVLRAHPNVTLQTVKYADAKLTLDLRLPDFETLEVIKNTLSETRRVRVEVLAANSRASGVEGRLRVQASAAGQPEGS
ncbi:MAG: type II secretion system protein GspL [Acidiferrobacterales bacterium]